MATVLKANVISQRAGQNVNFAEGLAAGNQIARTILENKRMKEQLEEEKRQFNESLEFERDKEGLLALLDTVDDVAEHSLNGYRDAYSFLKKPLMNQLNKFGVDPAASEHFLNQIAEMDMNLDKANQSFVSRLLTYGSKEEAREGLNEDFFNDRFTNIAQTGTPQGKITAEGTRQVEQVQKPQITDDMFISKQDEEQQRPEGLAFDVAREIGSTVGKTIKGFEEFTQNMFKTYDTIRLLPKAVAKVLFGEYAEDLPPEGFVPTEDLAREIARDAASLAGKTAGEAKNWLDQRKKNRQERISKRNANQQKKEWDVAKTQEQEARERPQRDINRINTQYDALIEQERNKIRAAERRLESSSNKTGITGGIASGRNREAAQAEIAEAERKIQSLEQERRQEVQDIQRGVQPRIDRQQPSDQTPDEWSGGKSTPQTEDWVGKSSPFEYEQKRKIINEKYTKTVASYDGSTLKISKGASQEMSSNELLGTVAAKYNVPDDIRPQWIDAVKKINSNKDFDKLDGQTLHLPLGRLSLLATQVQINGKPYEKTYINNHVDAAMRFYNSNPSEALKEFTSIYEEEGRIPTWGEQINRLSKRADELNGYSSKEKSNLQKSFKEGVKVLNFAERAALREKGITGDSVFGVDPYTTTDPRYLSQVRERITGVSTMDEETWSRQMMQNLSEEQKQQLTPSMMMQGYEMYRQQKYAEQQNILASMTESELSAAAARRELSMADYYTVKAEVEKREGELRIQAMQNAAGAMRGVSGGFNEENVYATAHLLFSMGPEYADDAANLVGDWLSLQLKKAELEKTLNPASLESIEGKQFLDAQKLVQSAMKEHGISGSLFSSDFYKKLKRGKLDELTMNAWDTVVSYIAQTSPELWRRVEDRTKDGAIIYMLQRAGEEEGMGLSQQERSELDAFIEQKMGQ